MRSGIHYVGVFIGAAVGLVGGNMLWDRYIAKKDPNTLNTLVAKAEAKN